MFASSPSTCFRSSARWVVEGVGVRPALRRPPITTGAGDRMKQAMRQGRGSSPRVRGSPCMRRSNPAGGSVPREPGTLGIDARRHEPTGRSGEGEEARACGGAIVGACRSATGEPCAFHRRRVQNGSIPSRAGSALTTLNRLSMPGSIPRVNRTGFLGGGLVWVTRPGLVPPSDHSSALLPRRAGCCRSVRAGGGC